MNPGQSIKDRAARQMILAAEKRGDLKPGGLIVEATAGNTGIGLALVARARGYRTIIVIPETQSAEKKQALRLAGATLVEVPAKPFKDPNNYQHIGRRLADQLSASEPNGVLFADQWNNRDNRMAHYLTTGTGDLAADRAARSTPSSARSAPAARWPARLSYLREKKARTSSSAAPIRRARPCSACSRPARRGERRQFDHRGHRPRPLDPDRRGRHRREALHHPRQRGPAGPLRSRRA